jgi:hypothetical protein
MAGLPRKYAKMGFKRGWAAYRSKHAYTTHSMAGHKKRHGGHKGKKGRVHHAMWLDGDMSAPAIIRSPIKRFSSITPGKIISPLVDIALIIAGMAGGALIKLKSPIKNPHLMNGVSGLVGVGGSMFTKNRFIKLPLIGLALQAGVAEAKTLWPNLVPLAGDDEVMYLPMDNTKQIEYMNGDDERVGAVVDGDDDEMSGEGRNS